MSPIHDIGRGSRVRKPVARMPMLAITTVAINVAAANDRSERSSFPSLRRLSPAGTERAGPDGGGKFRSAGRLYDSRVASVMKRQSGGAAPAAGIKGATAMRL